MIYDCDPADTISALRAANEDLAAQVKHWRGIVIANNPPIEELEFNLRAAKAELEIADGEINRLNGVIEKYRVVPPTAAPDAMREALEAARKYIGEENNPKSNRVLNLILAALHRIDVATMPAVPAAPVPSPDGAGRTEQQRIAMMIARSKSRSGAGAAELVSEPKS